MKNFNKNFRALVYRCMIVFVAVLCGYSAKASNYFWVNGTGNWSDVNGHWATTSGGSVFYSVVPGLHDNVFFDNNSFSQPGDTVYQDLMVASCNSMNWSAVTNNPVFSFSGSNLNQGMFNPFDYNLRIYGSLILSGDMDWNFSGMVGFVSNLAGNTIHSNGAKLKSDIYFDNPQGGWYFTDSLETLNINFLYGNLNTNNQFVNCYSFVSDYINTSNYLFLGSSEIHCKGNWNYSGDADKIVASNSVISFENILNNINNFSSSDSVAYNDVVYYDNGNLSFSADTFYVKKMIFHKNATFYFASSKRIIDTLIFDNSGYSVNIANASTLAIGSHTEFNGTCSGVISVKGNSLIQNNGTVTFNYCRFESGIQAIGGATFTATNSTQNNLSPCSGINFITTVISDLYWVGNSGNWNDPAHWSATSGGVGGSSCIPSIFTNIHIDNNSFSASNQIITVDSGATIYCRNFDWTSNQLNASLIETDSVDANLFVYGNFVISSAMNFNFSGAVHLKSTDIGNALTTGNNTLHVERFNIEGYQGSYSLNDSLIVEKSIVVQAGQFLTNGNYIYCKEFHNIDFGITDFSTSSVYITDISGLYNVNANNASFYLLGNSTDHSFYLYASLSILNRVESYGNLFYTGNNGPVFNHLLLHGNSTFQNAFVADSMFFDNPGKSLVLNSDTTANYQINYLSANGDCNALINIYGTGYLFVINPIQILAADISFALIKNLFVSNPITVNNSVDGGGLSSNITINALSPQNYFWVGGNGNWDDNTHWSYTSGGAPAFCVPKLVDHVFFDANSFNAPGQTVYVPYIEGFGCSSMNWTGAQFDPTLLFDTIFNANALHVSGSLTLIPQMNWINLRELFFEPGNGVKQITSAGHDLAIFQIYFESDILNGYQLNDSLNITGNIIINSGKFDSGNQYLKCNTLSISGSLNNLPITNANFGSSSVKSYSFLLANTSSTNIISGQNTAFECNSFQAFDSIDVIGSVTMVGSFYGAGNICNLNKLIIKDEATLSSTPGFIVDSLILNNPDHNLYIVDSLRVNNYLSISGNAGCQKYSSIKSTLSPQQANLIVPVGIVNGDYITISDINATGGATFNANHCIDVGNNSGWNINPVSIINLDYYWINGSGNWSDPQHWSPTSGGSPAGCVPSRFDNVHFDANSFVSAGDTVLLDLPVISCNDMDWTGVQFGPTMANFIYQNSLNIGGSLVLSPAMNFKYNRSINFMASDSGNVIDLAGHTLQSEYSFNQLYFSGKGKYDLANNFDAGDYFIFIDHGTLQSNNFSIHGDIKAGQNSVDKVYLDLGTSNISGSYFCNDTSRVGLNAVNAVFNCSTFFGGNYQQYGTLYCSSLFVDSCHFNKVVCVGALMSIPGYVDADSLIFENSVVTCNLDFIDTYINGKWIINNDGSHPVKFYTYSSNTTIHKSTDTLCFDNLFLNNLQITGGVTAFGGYNSVYSGNTTGWINGSCAMPIDSVWPGDANYDLIANNIDILNIGVGYGSTGPVRVNPSTTWTPQAATDWSTNFASGFNYKHADCNGDGVIDNNDTIAVNLNYGLTHPYRMSGLPPQIASAPLLYLVSSIDTAGLSQQVNVDIFLGNLALPVDSIYGIAFTVNFDPALIDTNSLIFDYNGSWLGTPGVDLLTYNKSFAPNGFADVALVRTDHSNVSGHGFIGRLGVVIVDNVTGRIVLPLSLSNITAITYGQHLLDFNNASDSVEIDTTITVSLHEFNPEKEVRIFPIPANDYLNIYSGDIKIQRFELSNPFGEIIYSEEVKGNKFQFNTSQIKNGTYFFKCFTENGIVIKRVEIIHK